MPEYHGRYDPNRWTRPEGNAYSVANATEHTVVSTAGNVLIALWNPSSAISLWVTFIEYDRLSQGTVDSENGLARITTQGTASVTVTPAADNGWNAAAAPASGALLQYGYTAEPTKAAPVVAKNFFGVSPDPGYSWQWGFTDSREDRRGFQVKPGTGLAIYRVNGGGSMQGYATFNWVEY